MLKLPAQSLTAKIILAGLAAIASFIAVMLLVSYLFISDYMFRVYQEKAETIANTLNAGIRSFDDLDDLDSLFDGIQKSIWLEPDLLAITIFQQQESGLVGIISNRPELIGNPASPGNLDAFRQNSVVTQQIDSLDGPILRVYSPIHVARRQIGTYQFDLTLETLDSLQRQMLNSLLMGYLPLIVVIILLLMLYIRRQIVLPVRVIRDGATRIAGGSLDTRVDIRSRDELGALSRDFNQMAESLKQQREAIVGARHELEHLALHDSLTGLANREYLLRRMPQIIAACRRHSRQSALLLLDLDQFKTVNDSLGHDIGDRLLSIIGKRLRKLVREEDFVARLGGDEFVVVLSEISADSDEALEQVNHLVNVLLRKIAQPARFELTEIQVTASVGIVLFPAADENFEQIMKNADSAMYRAKEDGGNRGRFFNQIMQHLLETRSRVMRTLNEAIHADQMRVFYQPQVNGDGDLIGVEALVRWMHPQYGLTLPRDFISVIENNHLIIKLSQWVLETVCRQYRMLNAADGPDISVSVNISSSQFHQLDFVEQVLNTLDRFDFPAHNLVLEITEGVLLRNLKDVREKIHRIKQHGIRISLDDYGTGYSSLTYLKNLELDEIKMDQSFVHDLFTSVRDQELVCSIISMSNSLDMTLVAEGVENEAQFDFLKAHDCECFQGYYFREPMPLTEFQIYRDGRTREPETVSSH